MHIDINQSEEYYRKFLLLDKLKAFLSLEIKQDIFNKGYFWDILLKDEDAPSLCYSYAYSILEGPFPEAETIIATDPNYSYQYARDVLKDRFPIAESLILDSTEYYFYIEFLEDIGKLHEVKI